MICNLSLGVQGVQQAFESRLFLSKNNPLADPLKNPTLPEANVPSLNLISDIFAPPSEFLKSIKKF